MTDKSKSIVFSEEQLTFLKKKVSDMPVGQRNISAVVRKLIDEKIYEVKF